MNEGALPASWGVRPVLFRVGGMPVPAYETFLLLALAAAVAVYLVLARRRRDLGDGAVTVLMAALVGGTLGAKLPDWLARWREIAAAPSATAVLSGRTIVGGLVGGTLAVIAVRRRLGIAVPTGNLFAPALALAIAVGRVGCFLRGCCLGVPTGLPWGVDFGDGVARHPTQLYEAAFALGLFAWLLAAGRRGPRPGALFRVFMVAYFAWRFGVEFVRDGPRTSIGLTLAQWAAVGVVAAYALTARQPGGVTADARPPRSPEPDAP